VQLMCAKPEDQALAKINCLDRRFGLQTQSYFENAVVQKFLRKSDLVMMGHSESQYRRTTSVWVGQNSENRWSYCGNLTPSSVRPSHNLFCNKGLYFYRNGPLVAIAR
jgi:hypothetical protein